MQYQGDTSRQLSNVHIHGERVIGLLKKFQYLETTVPIQQVDLLDNAMIKIPGWVNLNQNKVSLCSNIYGQRNLITEKFMSTMISDKLWFSIRVKKENWILFFMSWMR